MINKFTNVIVHSISNIVFSIQLCTLSLNIFYFCFFDLMDIIDGDLDYASLANLIGLIWYAMKNLLAIKDLIGLFVGDFIGIAKLECWMLL